MWPNGDCCLVYSARDGDFAKRHTSAWAMRNTNNHNKYLLKKSCLGVVLCSAADCNEVYRPAICDKTRRRQEGKQEWGIAFIAGRQGNMVKEK